MSKVDFIANEAAALGHLECVEDGLVQLRGYGINFVLVYQSVGQLKVCFPNGQDQTVLSNTTQILFGVNDVDTAEYASKRLGESTIILESGGSSSGSSSSWSFGGQPQRGGGTSDNTSTNWQQHARKLLMPEEVMALPPSTAITFTPGVPPIRTTLLSIFEEKWLTRPPGFIRRSFAACRVLAASLALFLVTTAFAFALTIVVKDEPWARQVTPPEVREVLDSFGSF